MRAGTLSREARFPDVHLGGYHALTLMAARCAARSSRRLVAATRYLSWKTRQHSSRGPRTEGNMDTTTLLIIILLVLLLGGGGWYGRGRWY